jgi:hypothetical protein
MVEYAGLCPKLDFSSAKVVDEGLCDVSNRPRLPIPSESSAQCANDLEYLVAVVASNKDSSVIVNVQTLLEMSGYHLYVSVFALLIAALTQMF